MRQIWHIIPTNDAKPHKDTVACACDPAVKNVNQSIIVIHNSYDGREAVEWAKEILK